MLAVLFNIFPDACRYFIIKLPHCHFRQPVIHCGIKVLKFVIRQGIFIFFLLSFPEFPVMYSGVVVKSIPVSSLALYILRCPDNIILEDAFLSVGYE